MKSSNFHSIGDLGAVDHTHTHITLTSVCIISACLYHGVVLFMQINSIPADEGADDHQRTR